MNHNHSHTPHNHSYNHDEHGHSHSHSHGHSHEHKRFGCSETIRLSIMLVMITLFFFLEIIAGRITNSITLVTDSFHMLSDVIALFIALFSVRISKKKSSKNTFGWIRAEILGALVNSVFLLALCVSIFIEAIERFIETETIREVNLLLYVACTGLAINTIGLFIFGHAHSHSAPVKNIPVDLNEISINDSNESSPISRSNNKANFMNEQNTSINSNNNIDINSSRSDLLNLNPNDDDNKETNKRSCFKFLNNNSNYNIRAVFLHVLADAFGSMIVITSALLNKYHENLYISSDIIHYVDPVLCLVLVAIILTTTIPLLKETALILLQTVPKEVKLNHLKEDLLKIQGILSIHELHIWKLSGTKIIATAHITCHNIHDYMQINSQVKKLFHIRGIHSTTIQVEFVDTISDIKTHCMLECINDCHEDTCCGHSNRMNDDTLNIIRQRNQQANINVMNSI